MYQQTPQPSRNFDYAEFLSRLDAATPGMIAALAQRLPQCEIAARLASNKTTVSLTKSGERMIDRDRQFALLALCVAAGCYAPVEALLSPDPAAPDVVIVRLPGGVTGDGDPMPELRADTVAEGAYLTSLEAGDLEAADAHSRTMMAAAIGFRLDVEARRRSRRQGRPSVPGAAGRTRYPENGWGDGGVAETLPEGRL